MPTYSISFTWVQTSSTIGGGILQNLFLKGSSSVTLISCFVRSVHSPIPQVPRKRCHGIQLVEHVWWLDSWWTTPPGQTSPVAGRVLPFSAQLTSLLSGPLAFCSSFSNIPGETPTCGMAFAAMTQVILTPLAMVIWVASQILHHNHYLHMLPVAILVQGIHDAQPMRQAGNHLPPPGLCIITCMLLPRNMVLVWACMIFEEKASISSFLVILTASFKLVRSHGIRLHSCLALDGELCSVTSQQVGYSQPIQWNGQLIYLTLSLITFMIWLIVSVPKMTGTQGAKSQLDLEWPGLLDLHYSPTPLPPEPLS